jgi:hypothetical protein
MVDGDGGGTYLSSSSFSFPALPCPPARPPRRRGRGLGGGDGGWLLPSPVVVMRGGGDERWWWWWWEGVSAVGKSERGGKERG